MKSTQLNSSGNLMKLLFVFMASLLASVPARSQVDYATGALRGTVLDAQGATVANAKVTIKNPATGLTKTITTSSDGAYQVLALNPGTYEVQVEAAGFENLVAKDVVVTVGQIVIYDSHLKIGAAMQTVEVTYNSAPLIELDQTQQANTINDLQVTNLPNVSRNFVASIYTLPGVVDSTAPAVQDPNIGTGYQTSGFSIGGSNGRNNLFTIDGGENDFGSGAPRAVHVPQDSVQEFQVNRNSFAPEFGFTVGTAINLVTKSGTNKFHGSAYGYFHDQGTDAANFFNSFSPNPTVKPFEQNAVFGATLGGPIKQDKLFFFASFERQKLDNPVVVNLLGTAEAQGIAAQTNGFNPATGTCPGQNPTAGQAQSVTQLCYLTQLANAPGPFAPLGAIGQAFLASPIFSPLEDPLVVALLAPNSGTFDGNAGGVVNAIPNVNGRYNNFVSRLDFQPNSSNSYSLRFSLYAEQNQVTGPGGLQRYSSTLQELRDYTITGSWSRIINPDLVNTLRVQVVPYNTSDNSTPFPGRAEIGLGSLGPLGTQFAYPYFGTEHRFQLDENLAWAKGKHSLKFGASYRPAEYNVFEQLWFNGQYNYLDGAFSILNLLAANPMAAAGVQAFNQFEGYPAGGPPSTNLSATESYVVGLPGTLLQAAGNGQYDGWSHYLGIFGQDSWKATRNLTVNYGARVDYDHEPQPVPNSVYVSPRLGLAWDVTGDGKTVVRAGSGLFIAPQIFLIPFYSNLLGTDGKHINLTLLSAGVPAQIPSLFGAAMLEQSLATAQNPDPALNTAQLAALGISIVPVGPNQVNGVFYTISPHYKSEYSIQSSLSVAREVARDLSLEVGYEFYRGARIQLNQEANYVRAPVAIDPFVGPFYIPAPGSTAGEPNTQILQNNQYSSVGNSTYHALTASLTKRYSRGLQFQANYTFSKAIDDTSDYSSLSTPFRPDLLSADRSVSDFNIKHSFVANAVYTTQLRRGSGALAAAFADITISPIVSVRTGVPFTLLVPGIQQNGAGAHLSEARPFLEGRNTGIGPGFASWDMRVSKSFYIKRDSGLRLDVIAQATNILNHTNFNRVNNIFPNTAVTQATATPPFFVTTSAVVPTAEGAVNLLNGPYTFKGFVPTSAAELSAPLAFQSADLPRQVSFGLQLAF